MDGRGEAEVARQALGDLRPRLAARRRSGASRRGSAGTSAAGPSRGRACGRRSRRRRSLRRRPVAPEALVARRPRRAAVLRLEGADALHDGEEVVRVVGIGDEVRDAEMAWRLVRRVVPHLAAVLAREGGEERERLAVVAALEDAGSLDADEEPVAGAGERRDLRDLPPVVVAVGQALARHAPRSSRGRGCGRSPSRATRSPLRRRSSRTSRRRSRGRRASPRRAARSSSTSSGRRSRTGTRPCGWRRSTASSTSRLLLVGL